VNAEMLFVRFCFIAEATYFKKSKHIKNVMFRYFSAFLTFQERIYFNIMSHDINLRTLHWVI
jgi:hypothetical protein